MSDYYGDDGDDDGEGGGMRDHIDVMLDHGRLRETCRALEAALAQTSQKLREVDSKAATKIRALESELRAGATTREQQQSSSSAGGGLAIEFHDDDDDDDDFYDYDDDAGVVKGDGRRTPSSSSSHDGEDDGRPRRRHRLTLVRRRIPAFFVAAVVAFVVLLVMTIALSLRRSDEALALAAEAEAEAESGALASGSTTTTGGVISSAEEEGAGATAGDDFGGYRVGIAETSTATTASSTVASTTTAAAPVDDDPDVGGPIWYSTTRRHYHEILASQGGLHNVSDIDPHDVANAYCRKMGKELCDYAAYCPDGRGSVPYGGGPPIDTTGDRTAVWAPFVPSGGGRMTVFGDAVPYWVQVGSIPVDGGGTDANDFASCWAYADWNDGGTFGDIDDVLGERRRLWMLCCEVRKDEDGGSSVP